MIKKFLKLELDFDFVLIAITSQLKDYRLCHFINKHTETDFKKADDFLISFKDVPSRSFACYHYQHPHTECLFQLVANKGNDGFLIPEMKETDYFIVIRDFIDPEDMRTFLEHLKAVKQIQAAIEIAPDKLKSKENLLF